MKRINVFKKVMVFGIIIGLYAVVSNAEVVIVPACEDIHIATAGGGIGFNPFLKFNISEVPADKQIDSVFLRVFVFGDSGAWDGDVNFWNVNNQDWAEDTSYGSLWNYPISDSTFQDTGFGMEIGDAFSVNLKSIFLKDYDVEHTYCSIKMRDPDDPTIGLAPFSGNLVDTLLLGNPLFAGLLYFYPRTARKTGAPYLKIHYTDAGINSEDRKGKLSLLQNSPNPFTRRTVIRYSLTENQDKYTNAKLTITDLSGRLVQEFTNLTNEQSAQVIWDTCDQLGNPVPGGIYFYTLTAGNYTKTKKTCLMR